MRSLIFALCLLSFLAPSHSAIIRSVYNNPQCTGDVLGGNAIPENYCLFGRKITCNATHVYSTSYAEVGCTGESAVEEPLPRHTCINNTQFDCGVSDDIPENSVFRARYSDSNCQGTITTLEWSKVNTCVPDPDGHGRSAFLSYEPEKKKPVALYYRTNDCTGESREGSLSPGGGDSSSYSTQEQKKSNLFYVYHYLDKECKGEPMKGSSYQPNTCAHGRMATCENGQFILANYQSRDCILGAPPEMTFSVELNLTTEHCTNGKKSFCDGSFVIPAKSQLLTEFDGSEPCKAAKSWSFARTEMCAQNDWGGSLMLTFNDTTKQFQYNTYQTEDCTGEKSGRTEDLFTNYGGINVKPTISS